jgi:hypothetical protein
MALAHQLTQAGFTVERIHTIAKVHFDQRDGGCAIDRIDLEAEAMVPGIPAAIFDEQAQTAKKGLSRVASLGGRRYPSPGQTGLSFLWVSTNSRRCGLREPGLVFPTAISMTRQSLSKTRCCLAGVHTVVEKCQVPNSRKKLRRFAQKRSKDRRS